jgi:vitamin B12 transporter
MKPLPLAGLLCLAALGAQAQVAFNPFTPSYPLTAPLESVVVTATRSLQATLSLRDATVITRDEVEAAGAISLGELLQRRAGVELRATGGPGQPQGIFIRGAGAAQTLVLVDGVRVNSATAGTTSIEAIPLEMIERIEVVRGPLSSLYGSEAAGGVIQIFTRGKNVPHFFASAGLGTDRDRRASAGLSTADATNVVSLSMGVRQVDAPSATNPRNFSYFPDRDPYENAFGTLHLAHRLWQGETLALDAFASRSRARFDAGAPADGSTPDDRSDQTLGGARFTSSTLFAPWWASRIVLGYGLDNRVYHGQFPAQFETRQEQASWINEVPLDSGALVVGIETVRQTVLPDRAFDAATQQEAVLFARNRRITNSAFVSVNQAINGQRLEASARRDEEDQFGTRNTGSLSYGIDWPAFARLSATWARGFRAPTFNDLYGPSFPGYSPNPALRPERNQSREIALASLGATGLKWRLTAFDNQLEDLIVFSPAAQTVLNVDRARIRGIEATVDGTAFGLRWHASLTAQRPHDEDSGKRLQGRAERFSFVEASRAFGRWSAALSVLSSGERFDSTDEAPGTRLPGYAVIDAHVGYAFDKHWSAQLALTNLTDRHYESAVGYDAPRSGVFLNVRFESY